MSRKFFYLFFLPICLASCASPFSHWVTRDQLQPATTPNIKLIELTDGTTIMFDQDLGWYDTKKQIIEGITITGWHDTTVIVKVSSVEITEAGHSNVGIILGAISLIFIGLSIAFVAAIVKGYP